jgi:hypothetical protein
MQVGGGWKQVGVGQGDDQGGSWPISWGCAAAVILGQLTWPLPARIVLHTAWRPQSCLLSMGGLLIFTHYLLLASDSPPPLPPPLPQHAQVL